MSKFGVVSISLVVCALLIAGISTGAIAGSPKKLRWVPSTSGDTVKSGAPYRTDYHEHVRVTKAMSTKPEDRHYAIRGMKFAGPDSRAVSSVPAFLHPDADRSIQANWYGDNDIRNPKEAKLPLGYFITSLQICDNGKTGTSKKLKGLRIWGHKLDAAGRPIQPTGPVEVKKAQCKKWRQKVSCPTGKIAHSYRSYPYRNSAIALVCAKVEPDVGNYNPYSAKGGNGSVFNTGARKLYLNVDVRNDSHTTGTVNFLDVKVMSAGKVLYLAKKTNPTSAMPNGYTKQVKFTVAADWNAIKQAGGCKVGNTCTVNIKGTIKATVSGLTETHTYSSSVSIYKN